MNILETAPLSLHNFEGPLDYLIHLVQRGEIDIYDIPLQLLTEQFVDRHLENNANPLEVGAEFVGVASTLVWLKSKRLLPQELSAEDQPEDNLNDARFEIIHQLLEYCTFKKAAQELINREQQQAVFRYRTPPLHEVPRPNGLENLPLDELAGLFQKVLARAASSTGKVYEEKYRVADAMQDLKARLKEREWLSFDEVFNTAMCREELIVFFLALLELMKNGDAVVFLVEQENCPRIARPSAAWQNNESTVEIVTNAVQ